MSVGNVRRSQLVTTYGVGAIVPVEDSAFMVMGLDRWRVGQPDLHEQRLERVLGVDGFMQPPASDGGSDVPVTRFPDIESCPTCRTLGPHAQFTQRDLNQCPKCDGTLVPSRFVVACPQGHIDEFPYESWVHEGRAPGGAVHRLSIQTTGTTGSLAGIVIHCSCGAERSMEDAFNRYALRGVMRCRGRHPWISNEASPCEELPRTLQRGSSSVWFGETRSALSIPPWSDGASRAMDAIWNMLRHVPSDQVAPIFAGMGLPQSTGYTLEELVEVHAVRKGQDEARGPASEGLRGEEYRALVAGSPAGGRTADFETRPSSVTDRLAVSVEQVQLVTRLREVRALVGFSRVLPPRAAGTDASNVVSIRAEGVPWLPAIEVKGEGIFLRLAENRLRAWSERPNVRERCEALGQRDLLRHQDWGVPMEREVSPAFLLLHILAHALIVQLSLDAGYPAASLRERVFAGPDMAGLLVYTATTDSGGSLGGLVAQGETVAFDHLLVDAIQNFAWCSSDPVCIETTASGPDSLNMAACHTCALLPETSCEERNLFLDRGLLVGWPAAPDGGFFSELI